MQITVVIIWAPKQSEIQDICKGYMRRQTRLLNSQQIL